MYQDWNLWQGLPSLTGTLTKTSSQRTAAIRVYWNEWKKTYKSAHLSKYSMSCRFLYNNYMMTPIWNMTFKRELKKRSSWKFLHACSHSLFFTASLYNNLLTWWRSGTQTLDGVQELVCNSLSSHPSPPHPAHEIDVWSIWTRFVQIVGTQFKKQKW